ncbi:MAG: hypothetical protein RIQ72_546 [Candidatus Parcubacteria bacterium]|jgi:hypothetical protein
MDPKKRTTRKSVTTASVAAATIIASLPLGAAVPRSALELSDNKLYSSSTASEFLENFGPGYALPKNKARSILGLAELKAWLEEKTQVYVCVQDGDITHCCTLQLHGRRTIQLVSVPPDTELPSGAIWLMVP